MLRQGDIAIAQVWRNNKRKWIDETAISDEEWYIEFGNRLWEELRRERDKDVSDVSTKELLLMPITDMHMSEEDGL